MASNPSILYLSINPMAPRINVGTTDGFYIYSIDPFALLISRFFGKGIGLVEQLRASNIFALCGGGSFPWESPTRVNIWDDNKMSVIGYLESRTPVKKIQFTNSYLLLILERETAVYDLDSLTAIRILQTDPNIYSLGLITILNDVIALASNNMSGMVLHLKNRFRSQRYISISRHPLRYLSVNDSGTLLAASSVEGTKIKIINLMNGEALFTFPRGWEHVEIASIRFSPTSSSTGGIVIVTSSKKTAHLYRYGSGTSFSHSVFSLPASSSCLDFTSKNNIYRCVWVDNSSRWKPGYTVEILYDDKTKKIAELNRTAFPTSNNSSFLPLPK